MNDCYSISIAGWDFFLLLLHVFGQYFVKMKCSSIVWMPTITISNWNDVEQIDFTRVSNILSSKKTHCRLDSFHGHCKRIRWTEICVCGKIKKNLRSHFFGQANERKKPISKKYIYIFSYFIILWSPLNLFHIYAHGSYLCCYTVHATWTAKVW